MGPNQIYIGRFDSGASIDVSHCDTVRQRRPVEARDEAEFPDGRFSRRTTQPGQLAPRSFREKDSLGGHVYIGIGITRDIIPEKV